METIKSWSRLSIDDEFQLFPNSCIHGPSFMPLVLPVTEKHSKIRKLDKSLKVSEPLKVGEYSVLTVELSFTLQAVSMIKFNGYSPYEF